jgi:hypothetical protein
LKVRKMVTDDSLRLPISSKRPFHSAIARTTMVFFLIIVLLSAALGYVSLSQMNPNSHTTSTRTVTETTGRTYTYTSTQTIISSQSTFTLTKTVVLSSPCIQKPPEPTHSVRVFRNGTFVANSSYPVFALQPGSTGTFCLNYSNPYSSTVSGFPLSVFDWKNWSSLPEGFSLSEYPGSINLPPGHNDTIIYTVTASNSSAGNYGLSPQGISCIRYPLAVSSNPSTITLSDFPGLLSPVFGCPAQSIIPTLLGFNGFTTAYLRQTTRGNLGYNITSQSVSSVIESSTKQNITFTVGIQSFSFPITVWFATGPGTFSTIREFNFNPQVTPIPGDACDWNISNQSVYSNGNWREFPLPAQGFTINAPTLHLQPYSQGTFRFSMLVSNLTAGYYVTFLGFVITWQNSPGINTSPDLGTYFPISVGSGQWNQNITGSCPTSSGD